MATKRLLKIDIVSDVACPWCFIGKRNFDKAMKTVSEKYDFNVRFHPYQLMPGVPPEGYDKIETMMKRMGGSREMVEKRMQSIDAPGKLANIEFAHGGRIWNTFDAHRLIQWGFKRGGSPLQSALKEECMHRYFEKSENVSAPEVLADIAVTAGIPKDEAERFLRSDELVDETRAQIASWTGRIDGVPFFVINDRFAVSGGQQPAAFIQAFERAASV